MRPTITIAELLTATPIGLSDLDYTLSYQGQDIVAVNTAEVRRLLNLKFYEWRIFTKGNTLQEKYSQFVLDYKNFRDETVSNFSKIFEALMVEYDPTSDYSRHEQESHKNTRTVGYGKTATTTATDYETKTEYNSSIADETTTYNNTQTLRPAVTTTRDGDDTTTVNGEMETALTGTDTITDTRLKADNQKDITGNNRSPQDAIQSEINLRLEQDMADIVVNEFGRRFLFLLAGEEDFE